MERRKSPRIKGGAKVVYKFMGIVGERRDFVVDIGQGGIRMAIREKAKKGDLMELGVLLDEGGEPFFTLGKVVWQAKEPAFTRSGKGYFETGIQFCEMDIEHKMVIIKYIYDRYKKERPPV
ncbi:MAG: PilZ domain-containing protein [Candidatus Omnitrophica bacterium]|nr:PilZ domain-containing protein [Candidatus Omnitrophota bacterium]